MRKKRKKDRNPFPVLTIGKSPKITREKLRRRVQARSKHMSIPAIRKSSRHFLRKFYQRFPRWMTKYLHKIQLSVSSGEVTALESQDENLVLAVEKAIMQGIAGRK